MGAPKESKESKQARRRERRIATAEQSRATRENAEGLTRDVQSVYSAPASIFQLLNRKKAQ